VGYVAAVTVAAVLIAACTHWRLFPVLPVVIACFHFGYGYGFLRGLLDFVVLNNAPEAKFVRLTRERAAKPGNARS